MALYFTDEPPAQLPSALLLNSKAIDIQAGDSAYVVRDSRGLSVDVEVLSIYPHAHFLGKEMDVFATLPNGGSAFQSSAVIGSWSAVISSWI